MTAARPVLVSARTGLGYDRARFETDAPEAIEPLRVFRPANSALGFSALLVRERYREVTVEEIPSHILVKVLDPRPTMRGWIDGTRANSNVGQAGQMTLLPACAPSRWHDVPDSRIIQLHFDPRAIAELTGEARVRELRIASAFEDRPMSLLVDQVVSGLADADRLYLEGLGMQIASRLLSHHSADRVAAVPTKGGLAPWQIRRVQEYLAENLAQDVGIAELAAIARLSAFHFARAFKTSVGVPPHAYQRRLRIDRARELLADPSLSVIEVALCVGFDSPQAFARTFRRETGATPTEFRREKLH